MTINYNKLWKIQIDKKMKRTDLIIITTGGWGGCRNTTNDNLFLHNWRLSDIWWVNIENK